MSKRALDLALAAVLLAVLLPLLLLIVLAIVLDSRGSPIFHQRRVGIDGRCFRLIKFRTMVIDADRQAQALMSESKDPHWLHLEHDPRVTRVGRLLRLTSLDELPQLLNVVRGEMSLVGPRPLSERDARMVPAVAQARNRVLPGITGPWQVSGRTRITFEEMLALDCDYAANRSFWRDVVLLARTIPAVLTARGAN